MQNPTPVLDPIPPPDAAREPGRVRLEARVRFWFDLHWLHESGIRRIGGLAGIPVAGGCDASVRFETEAAAGESAEYAGPPSFVSVSCNAALEGAPSGVDALAAAILGVHELQWLEHLGALAASQPSKLPKMIPDCTLADLEGFFAWWQSLDRELAFRFWQRADAGGDDLPQAGVLKRLRARAGHCAGADVVRSVLAGEDALAALDEWARQRLTEFAGGTSWPQVNDAIQAAWELQDEIYKRVPIALERVLAQEAARVFQKGCMDPGALSGLLTAPQRIPVQLPFLRRREWTRRREAVAAAAVTVEPDGAVVVSRQGDAQPAARNLHQALLMLAPAQAADHGEAKATASISFCDEQTAPAAFFESIAAPVLADYGFDAGEARGWIAASAPEPADRVATSVTVSIPASAAACWRRTPSEKESAFLPVYAAISTAVQKMLRSWLPYLYFAEPDRYRSPAAALPLLVYAASQPFPGKSRQELTYDVLNSQNMALFFRTSARHLALHLDRVSRALRAAGCEELAASYRPQRAAKLVESQAARPRAVMRFLAAETWIVNTLVNFGCKLAREKNGKMDPLLLAEKLLVDLHAKLRKLHGGQDFLELVPLLLIEATCALSTAVGEPLAPEVRLRLRMGGAEKTAVRLRVAAPTA